MKTALSEVAGTLLGLADKALTTGADDDAIRLAAAETAQLLEAEGRRLLHLARQLGDAARMLSDQKEEVA
jgi:hypothetical protein